MKDLEKKIRRYNLMHIHRGLVKDGKYAIAKNILWLLVNGSVKLGLGDTDWETEKLLEKSGCKFSISGRSYTATAWL